MRKIGPWNVEANAAKESSRSPTSLGAYGNEVSFAVFSGSDANKADEGAAKGIDVGKTAATGDFLRRGS